MAITDLQISDTLETSAPSIRYEGNEGPKSPQEQQQMMTDALLREEYDKYVYDLLEQRPEATPMSFEEFRIMVIGEGQMSSAQPMPNRQMAAYGGIMDSASGRRAYGLGSIFKKITRPIKKVLKSDVGKAALVGAGIYGLGGGFGMPGNWGLNKGFSFGKMIPNLKSMAVGKPGFWSGVGTKSGPGLGGAYTAGTKGILGAAGKFSPLKALGFASALPFTGVGMGEEESLDLGLNLPDSQKFDVDFSQMRKDIADAVTSGVEENFHEVLANYGLTEGVNINRWEDIRTGSAEGGRIGLYAGGQSIPSDYTIEDAMMTTTQDKLGGITDVMKQADLYRQGSVGQMYAAQGGRIGYRYGKTYKDATEREKLKKILKDKDILGLDTYSNEELLALLKGIRPSRKQGRSRKQEGGLMDLGGMEKDYRNDGGFVPIGEYEKKDDVPARLSKNEFVFTADAVRGAGGGDIDKGAEIMENVMKNLEQGGQISEESQGLGGAQEMFDVSERLSEVV